MLSIPADAAIVIVAAVLAVEGVPGVREIHAGPCRVVERDILRPGGIGFVELPRAVEADVAARICRRRVRQQHPAFQRLYGIDKTLHPCTHFRISESTMAK